jgi:hypothetical protein
MATLASPQKITFAEMRESSVRGLLIYCTTAASPLHRDERDQWPHDVRLSDIELRFTCTACGKRGADGHTAISSSLRPASAGVRRSAAATTTTGTARTGTARAATATSAAAVSAIG